MRYTIGPMVLLILLRVTSAEAELANTTSVSVCALLGGLGLAAGPWRNIYGNEYGCNSPYKDIGSGIAVGMKNNLAYYVDGSRDFVNQAKLVLNVNDRSQAQTAHAALIAASAELSAKIAGAKLLQSTKISIAAGNSSKAQIGKSTIEVKRDDWPTGKGYELHVIFK